MWYLDRLPDGRRGEEVRPADLVGPPGGGGEVGDGDGGGVGEEKGFWRQYLVELGEDFLLRPNLLDDGLDGRIYSRHVLQVHGPVDAVVVLLGFLLRKRAPVHEAR